MYLLSMGSKSALIKFLSTVKNGHVQQENTEKALCHFFSSIFQFQRWNYGMVKFSQVEKSSLQKLL